jgi:hypothetical protein
MSPHSPDEAIIFDRPYGGSGLKLSSLQGSNGAVVGNSTGEADNCALRFDFDRRLLLGFRGSTITSVAGLLAYRELDNTLGLTDTGAETLADARKNGSASAGGAAAQSVLGRLAGYEDVNNAERLRCEPAIRAGSTEPTRPQPWPVSRMSGRRPISPTADLGAGRGQPAYSSLPRTARHAAAARHQYCHRDSHAEHRGCAWQGLIRGQGRRGAGLPPGERRLHADRAGADG